MSMSMTNEAAKDCGCRARPRPRAGNTREQGEHPAGRLLFFVLYRVERASPLNSFDHLQHLRLGGVVPYPIHNNLEAVSSLRRTQCCSFLFVQCSSFLNFDCGHCGLFVFVFECHVSDHLLSDFLRNVALHRSSSKLPAPCVWTTLRGTVPFMAGRLSSP